jgi:hypothetical protein
LKGDVHDFTTIWELHYISPNHGEVYGLSIMWKDRIWTIGRVA